MYWVTSIDIQEHMQSYMAKTLDMCSQNFI